jgi:hypothetical protein
MPAVTGKLLLSLAFNVMEVAFFGTTNAAYRVKNQAGKVLKTKIECAILYV